MRCCSARGGEGDLQPFHLLLGHVDHGNTMARSFDLVGLVEEIKI